MATILIVDDRPANREFLVSLLGYGGHRLLEAGDGAEGLAAVRAERPDLVIADILMPTMDGYEFVRQLRADETFAKTRIVFMTAHFHEPEAHRLAAACGITDVLTKPCEPEIVLRTVEAALGQSPDRVAATTAGVTEFDRDHLKLLTDKLSRQVDAARRMNERLTALVDLGLQLGSERDPKRLLQAFCDAARLIVGAKYALVGIREKTGSNYQHFLTSGMDIAMVAKVGRPGPLEGVLGSVIDAGQCFRSANNGRMDGVGVPANFPYTTALLAAPVVSPAHVYGWVCLLDKVGGDAFTDEDERFARILSAQVGRIYENGSLYADLLRHSTKLAEEIADRKRAEAAMRAGEAHLRGFFEATSVGMAEADAGTGRLLRANSTFCRMFGYKHEEISGLNPEDLVTPDDLPVMAASYSSLREGRLESYEAERRFRHSDGSELWVQLSAALVRDVEGRPARIVAVLSDVTARKRAEAELRHTTDLLKAVSDGTTDAVFVKDRQGKYLFCNPATARLFGLHPDEMVGRTDSELFNVVDARIVAENDSRAMETGQIETSEEVLTVAGQVRTFLATKGPYRDEHGEVAGVIGISRDISDRKRAEEMLLLRDRAIQAVSQGILITDPNQADNPIIYASTGFERMTGYTAAEYLGRNCRFLQGKGTDPSTVARLRDAIMNEQPCRVEILNYRKDGTSFWNELSITPVLDSAGRLTHFVGVQTDITARKSLEEQFRQSQKMEAVGRLAGGVAHDFNNLLTIINGYGELVLNGLPPDDPNRDLIREVVAAGERAAGLTRQLLTFSRKSIISPELLDLNVVVTDIERMLRRVVGEDVQLTVIAHPVIGAVRADRGQIEQVLMNLVVNARDAMPTGGKLILEVHNVEITDLITRTLPDALPGRYVLLSVTDTGCGMDAATLARIFEPFFTTKGEHGTGLGLATVHGIVKQSGGFVDVDSEVGRGTIFRVYLPLAEKTKPSSRPRQDHHPALPRGGETVLLVEDEDGVRALSRHILRKCGYSVMEARDGLDAVRFAEQHLGRIDILVTDVVMPRLSGSEVVKRIKERHPETIVLFLSGYTDDAVVRHGILEDEVAFLQKPFTPASLAAKVRDLLDARK